MNLPARRHPSSRRLRLLLALLVTAVAASGQAVPPSAKSVPASSNASLETIVLTPFEVVSDTDNGLLSTNSVSATKGNTPIK